MLGAHFGEQRALGISMAGSASLCTSAGLRVRLCLSRVTGLEIQISLHGFVNHRIMAWFGLKLIFKVAQSPI